MDKKYLLKENIDIIINNAYEYCNRISSWSKDPIDENEIRLYSEESIKQLREYIALLNNDVKKKMSYKKWFKLCHKYIELANVRCQQLASDELQTIWHDGCLYFDSDFTKLYLNDCSHFTHKYNKNSCGAQAIIEKVLASDVEYYNNTPLDDVLLTYRNINAILNIYHNVAFTLDSSGELKAFDIQWDWWYPIDRYLDSIDIPIETKEKE